MYIKICKIIKLVGKKGEYLWDLGLQEEFLDLTPKAGFIKGKWRNWKEKRFSVKDSVNRMKRQATGWEKKLAYISDKELVTRIYKELSTTNSKKQTTQLENGQKTWIETWHVFTEKGAQMADKPWKDGQHHSPLGKRILKPQ